MLTHTQEIRVADIGRIVDALYERSKTFRSEELRHYYMDLADRIGAPAGVSVQEHPVQQASIEPSVCTSGNVPCTTRVCGACRRRLQMSTTANEWIGGTA